VTAEISAPTDVADVVLGPATRLLWRSPQAVHLEVGGRAVVVEGLPDAVLHRVASPVRPRGPSPALSPPVRDALATLTEAGYLWPRPEPAEPDPRWHPPAPRLAGQLAALAAQYGASAADVLRSRQAAAVEVGGRSRVGPHIAAVLAAAGVGRVHCAVDGTVRLAHLAPGGVAATDEGAPFAVAAEAAVRRAAPEVDTAPLAGGERTDLTVIATDGPMSEDRLTALHAADAPYLVVTLGLDSGVVGPLVVPGVTSCVRCADLHRRDRDPAWGSLAVQLSVGHRYGPAADATVATVLAGVAAQQALCFLDGGDPAAVDGTIELQLPDWRLRRRSRPRHPACACAGDQDRA
jgi:bacteriocin biosynthesis cyclodehydratase domain-containing protein